MELSDDQLEEKTVTRELPDDLIGEILTWLPSYSLRFSCKLVCKDWQRLITTDQSFLKLRQLRTPTISGFFFQTKSLTTNHCTFIPHPASSSSSSSSSSSASVNIIPSPTLDFLPCHPPFYILACSIPGLLCCACSKNTCYYICKPCTKQWHQIPSPNTSYQTSKLALMHVTTIPYLRYKIVRFSRSHAMIRRHQHDDGNSYHCEIFNSDNGEWKCLEDVIFSSFAMLRWGPSVLINGIFHWVLFRKYREDNIFAFDIGEERMARVELPQEIIERKRTDCRKNLVDFNGKLGLIYYIKGELLEIWVLEDYKKEKWEKKWGVSHDDHQENSCLTESFPLNIYKDGHLLMKSFTKDQVIWIDYRRNSREEVKIYPETKGLRLLSYQAFPFQSDFVPISTWDHKS